LTLDDYLKIEKKTKEQLREELRPQAEARLKRSLALGRVVTLEGLTIGDEEVNDRIETLSAAWGERAGDMRTLLAADDSRRMLAVDLLTDKAVDRLVAIAKGEDVPPPPAAGEAAAEAQPVMVVDAPEEPGEGEAQPAVEGQGPAETEAH
jgi:trigger factor